MKKHSSRVQTDVFPQLLHEFADLFALPLTDIYNCISTSKIWPLIWKREYVTVIPKKSTPRSVNDLRNISSTTLPSKIYESFVLQWLKKQIRLKDNQFGGIKGCSVEHLLCCIWHEIGINLEDNRAATLMTAVDYSKAFNRMDYKQCLSSLARLGTSSDVLEIVATFL